MVKMKTRFANPAIRLVNFLNCSDTVCVVKAARRCFPTYSLTAALALSCAIWLPSRFSCAVSSCCFIFWIASPVSCVSVPVFLVFRSFSATACSSSNCRRSVATFCAALSTLFAAFFALFSSFASPASNLPLSIAASYTRSPTTSAIAHTPCHQLPDEFVFVVGQMRRLELDQFPVFVVVFALPLFQFLVLA